MLYYLLPKWVWKIRKTLCNDRTGWKINILLYWNFTYFNENSKTELKIHQLSSKKVSVKIILKRFSSSEKTSKTLWLKNFTYKNTIFVSSQVTYENV